ncbi:TSN7-like protein [Mya arenaria]|uniref:Tetraspanin n=1 Tax=Mya arenaria TaxID=6604 RepID=A0ABY7GB42_MYAAR|nr:TSN7-like protein [Mya arenaria]
MPGGRFSSAMSSGPAVALTKSILTIFNFIFWISGIAILAVGIWAKVQLYIYMELSTVYYKEAPYILIGVGAVIVLVGSFGCCCTFKGNACLLYMYSVFLVLVFIVELSTGAAGFIYKKKLSSGFEDGLAIALNHYDSDKGKTEALDGLQHNLHCCGRHKYQDWFTTPWEEKQKKVNVTNIVPKSCCRGKQAECKNTNLPGNATTNSTLDIYTELFGALLACCLAKNINKAKYEQVQ